MKILFKLIGILFILTSCTNMDRPVDKSRLRPYDYRLFQGTEAWQLAKAAKMKDIRRVNQLLDDNPELANIADSVYGNTILMLALYHQDHKLFRTLLDHNANVNYHDTYNGHSPLIEACHYKGYDQIYAKELVEYGANINDTSSHLPYAQVSPLMAAAGDGNMTLVKYLIENGANINYSNNFGTTVLGQALISEEYSTSLMLLENGADYTVPAYKLNKSDNDTIPISILICLRYMTPPRGTSDYKKKREIIKFLKERGLDYDTVPIPNHVIKRIKDDYPLSWKWYLQNY